MLLATSNYITLMESYHNNNQLTINSSKTKVMLNTNNTRLSKLVITHNNQILVNQFKILVLGVITNRRNNFEDHITTGIENRPNLLLTTTRKLNLLRKLRYWTSDKYLKTLTNALLNGPLQYGITLWGQSNVAVIEKN